MAVHCGITGETKGKEKLKYKYYYHFATQLLLVGCKQAESFGGVCGRKLFCML